MNQNFSSEQLIKLCKKSELKEFADSQSNLVSDLDKIFKEIIKEDFEFQIHKVYNYYLTDNLYHKLVIRKLNNNLKKLYKNVQANRDIIIKQIKTLLEETCEFWILKSDIKGFYENINREKILSKFKDDGILTFQSIFLLKKLFSHQLLTNETGLPRGMSISSTLSEIYMRRFDKWIVRYPDIYYYARFVDDIIIFAHSSESLISLKNQMNQKLSELAEGLMINEDKTTMFTGSYIKKSRALEYLGYKFIRNSQKKNEKLLVTIADKKVKKIKTKIILSLLDFMRNKNFDLLLMRMGFLAGNYSIRKGLAGHDLKAGLYYNYPQVNDTKVFEELTIFFNKALHSKKGSFGRKITTSLTKVQINKLCTYSFKFGFLNKIYTSFTSEEMKQITGCWRWVR